MDVFKIEVPEKFMKLFVVLAVVGMILLVVFAFFNADQSAKVYEQFQESKREIQTAASEGGEVD